MAIFNLTDFIPAMAVEHCQHVDGLTVTGFSNDSRTIAPGQLYVAIKGPNFDGHNFIEQAVAKGAAAVLVSQPLVDLQIPYIQVKDTVKALAEMAHYWRQQFTAPVVGITGSCGKTTTKSMVTSILSVCGRVHATKGTRNNDIGLPLTLLDMSREDDFAVIEMGANHFGDIAYLTDITRPNVAMITNAAAAHLEGFGDVAGVARGKGEIFQGLSAHGTAIINLDDEHANYWLQVALDKKIITFGLTPKADVSAHHVTFDNDAKPSFMLKNHSSEIKITLPVLGNHNVSNALAAAAAAIALGVSLRDIKTGLEKISPEDKRLNRLRGLNHSVIIDDSYNANPTSFGAALHVLAQHPGEKILVIGDMGELGDDTGLYHQQLGHQAHQYGISRLYGVGKFSQQSVESFGRGGKHFSDQQQLIKDLIPVLNDKTAVLVKGSRSAKMENVVQALMSQGGQ